MGLLWSLKRQSRWMQISYWWFVSNRCLARLQMNIVYDQLTNSETTSFSSPFSLITFKIGKWLKIIIVTQSKLCLLKKWENKGFQLISLSCQQVYHVQGLTAPRPPQSIEWACLHPPPLPTPRPLTAASNGIQWSPKPQARVQQWVWMLI